MNIDYGNILTRAWQITWKHKILWIFGILAGLGSGGGGNAGSRGTGDFTGPGGQLQLPPEIQRFADRFDQNVLIAIGLGLVCLVVVIAIVLIALQVIGRGGLIGGVQLAESTGTVTFGQAWSVGIAKFWTLFLIGLLVGIVTLVLVLVVVLPGILLSIVTLGLGVLCLLPLICLLAIGAAILGVIAYFAQIAAVLENRGVTDALSRAWDVIRTNVGPIIILGLILIVVRFLIGIILFLPILIIVAPVVLAAAGFANDSQALGYGGIAFALICCAIYLPILLVLGGILETWVTSAWTLAYQQFTRQSPLTSQPSAPPVVPLA